MAIEEEEYQHDQPVSSDDDDAPEEVGKETAKQDALEQLERERSARTAVAEAAKTRRRAEIERNTEQQRAKRERQTTSSSLSNIPYDLLAKVAAKRKEEEEDTSEPEESSHLSAASKSKPRPPQSKIRTTVFSQPRELETQATTFTAVNLASSSELTSPLIALRKDKSSCFAFRDRMLFDRKRLKRIHSGTVASYQAKRAASKHS